MTPIDWLWGQLQHNQFLAAALVAAPVSVLSYSARAFPLRLWNAAKSRVMMSVTFNSDLPDFGAVQEFVAERVVSQRLTRNFVYAAETSWNQATGEMETVHRGLTPGYGAHFGWWQRCPVFINREQQPNNNSERFKEQMTLTFVTRNRKRVEDFADQVRQHGRRNSDRDHISLFVNSGGWWRCASRLPKRPMSTVCLPAAEKQAVVEHVRAFEERQGWYRERGLPWHTGILLTGKPGTGKTSLVHALASELARSLYYLNLGSIESDQQLSGLVAASRDWRRALLVIEDADAGGLNVQRNPAPAPALTPQTAVGAGPAPEAVRQPVTLSALLNVLDGLLTPDGLVVVASSNHPEKLDPALLRPGRFDLHLEIGDLDWFSFAAMARLFGFDVADDDPRRPLYRPAPGATVRAKLLSGGVDAVLASVVESAAA